MALVIHKSFCRSFGFRRFSLPNSSLRKASSAPKLYDPPSSKAIATASASSEQDTTRALPYRIHRTASKQLPIYHLAKRGGNLLQTRLRKIEGDISALRNDLQQALGLKEEHIVINQLTKHIIIKGWRKPEVSNFLERMRF